jgi:hypothetical protein
MAVSGAANDHQPSFCDTLGECCGKPGKSGRLVLLLRKRSHGVSGDICQHGVYCVKQGSHIGGLGRLGPDEGPDITIGDNAAVNPELVDIVPVAAFVGKHGVQDAADFAFMLE